MNKHATQNERDFLTQEQKNILIDEYTANNWHWDYNFMIEVFEKYNIYSLSDIKDYVEQEYKFAKYLKALLKRLEEEEVIVYSKRGNDYYSLKNERSKGFSGYSKANKYIFENYIKNDIEYTGYNNLYDSIKKETIDDLFIRFRSISIHGCIRCIYSEIIIPQQMFKLQYKIDYEEI